MITQIIDKKSLARATELINKANRIVPICHTGPDGDAIGSSLATVHVLSDIGKDIKAIIPDKALDNLRSLPGAKDIVNAADHPEFAAKLINEADLIICLDFNTIDRAGRLTEVLQEAKAPKILIDHHLGVTIDATLIISHPEMCATCCLLFYFICGIGLFNAIDRNAAECMLAGIMTDTGNFSYNCDDPELYIITAELVRKGADKEKLYNRLFNTFSANCLRLNSYAILKKMEVFHEGHAALITLTRDELNRFKYVKGDTEGLVNRPLAIPGIIYSCFMRQETDCIRVSMRSRGSFPVNELCAEHYGGGGHLNAAGGEFYGSLEDAAALFRSLIKENNKKYIENSKFKNENI